jgi:TonB family protein
MLLASSVSAPATQVKSPSKVAGTDEKKKSPDPSITKSKSGSSETRADKVPPKVPHVEEAASVIPPTIPGGPTPSTLESILAAKAILPGLSPPMSKGVSGGQLLHRVSPVYPAQAKMFRLEGKVILDATVMEDGSVRDAKVVQGETVLAKAAVEAVKQWRYQPFVLNGKPVQTETRITIDFRFPSKPTD